MNVFLTFFKILTIFGVILCSSGELKVEKYSEELKRQKRFLIFPNLTYLQMIIGLGTPVPDLTKPATTLGFFVRGIYQPVINSTYYTNPQVPEVTRKKRSVSRWDFYNALAQDSEMRGHGGRSCVLRAICEASEVPIDRYHGFFEEVFYSIFTPNIENEELSHHTDNEYLAAHHLGKTSGGKCKHLFPDCKFTFLDLFTKLMSKEYT